REKHCDGALHRRRCRPSSARRADRRSLRGSGTLMLEIALDADEEWDSSCSWDELARRAAEAAIAESAFAELASSERVLEVSIRLTSDEQVRALNAEWRGKDK